METLKEILKKLSNSNFKIEFVGKAENKSKKKTYHVYKFKTE